VKVHPSNSSNTLHLMQKIPIHQYETHHENEYVIIQINTITTTTTLAQTTSALLISTIRVNLYSQNNLRHFYHYLNCVCSIYSFNYSYLESCCHYCCACSINLVRSPAVKLLIIISMY